MLLGIMSDSHGDVDATARAVTLLEMHGATRFVHCGDICDPYVLDVFAGRDLTFVWGNCDRPTASVRRYIEGLGFPWPVQPVRMEVAGKRIGVYHGHEAGFDLAAREDGLNYILHGHSHEFGRRIVGGCCLINPGALSRARIRTVAVLNVPTGRATFLRIDTGGEVAVAREPGGPPPG